MINYIFVIILCIILCGCSFVLALKSEYKIMKVLCSILLFACIFRYITLLIFCLSQSGAILYNMRFLVMLSAPALTIVPLLILFIINKVRISPLIYSIVAVLLCVYSYIIVKAPNGITISNDIYKITVDNMMKYIIAAVQFIFIASAAITAVKLAFKKGSARHVFINVFYIIACISSIAENFLMIYGINILPSSIISELIFLFYIFISLYFYI